MEEFNKQYMPCPYDITKHFEFLGVYRKTFREGFCYPLGSFYRAFPTDLTKFKFDLIGQYSSK